MHHSLSTKGLALLLGASLVKGQAFPVVEFSLSYNSSFSLTKEQIAAANLSDEVAAAVNTVMNTDRSNLANGGPSQDDFYTVPQIQNVSKIKPGQALKVQAATDALPFGIAPGATLSRILYTSETINGTVVPASAYILWPFEERKINSQTPIVLWNHGTSGYFADSAPSAWRNLQYGDMMPNSLVQSGYIVVAPDYAGLGVDKSWDGSYIPHQYFTAPSQARDAVYALQAARDAFKGKLDGKYAVLGHSQGGGVAWATAEYLAQLKSQAGSLSKEVAQIVKDNVGTIAMSPITKVLSIGTFATIVPGMNLGSLFPDFKLEKWFTPMAIARVNLLKDIQGTASVAQQLFLSATESELLTPDWSNGTYYANAFEKIANVGGRDLAAPLLVTQSTGDIFVSEPITKAAVEKTCANDPKSSVTYLVADGYGHTPPISALRLSWMQWLEDRFNGKEIKTGCHNIHKDHVDGSAAAGYAFPQWAGSKDNRYAYLNVGSI